MKTHLMTFGILLVSLACAPITAMASGSSKGTRLRTARRAQIFNTTLRKLRHNVRRLSDVTTYWMRTADKKKKLSKKELLGLSNLANQVALDAVRLAKVLRCHRKNPLCTSKRLRGKQAFVLIARRANTLKRQLNILSMRYGKMATRPLARTLTIHATHAGGLRRDIGRTAALLEPATHR